MGEGKDGCVAGAHESAFCNRYLQTKQTMTKESSELGRCRSIAGAIAYGAVHSCLLHTAKTLVVAVAHRQLRVGAGLVPARERRRKRPIVPAFGWAKRCLPEVLKRARKDLPTTGGSS
jgi:hypothetical protein